MPCAHGGSPYSIRSTPPLYCNPRGGYRPCSARRTRTSWWDRCKQRGAGPGRPSKRSGEDQECPQALRLTARPPVHAPATGGVMWELCVRASVCVRACPGDVYIYIAIYMAWSGLVSWSCPATIGEGGPHGYESIGLKAPTYYSEPSRLHYPTYLPPRQGCADVRVCVCVWSHVRVCVRARVGTCARARVRSSVL